MSPIEPGTLCVIIDRNGDAFQSVVGRMVTALGATDIKYSCGHDVYKIDSIYVVEVNAYTAHACRALLQPILPPGVDTSEPVVNLLPEPVV